MVDAGNARFGAGSHWLEYRELPADDPDPDAAIRELIARSMQAWADDDMQGHLAYFTDGAVLVTPEGSCHRGHASLLAAFRAQRAAMSGLQMQADELQITHTGIGTAIVLMEGMLLHAGRVLPQRWATTQFVVHGPDGRWRIASHQVFHRREVPPAG